MSTDSSYTISRSEHYLRVTLPDAIDMEESDTILKSVEDSIKVDGDLLVIDLIQTTMIYSSGFGLLIRLRKLLTEKNGTVAIVNVTPKINNFFIEFNLEKVFKIYSTDVEFELDYDHIWRSKYSANSDTFIFVAQKEDGLYRVTISGHLDTVNDLSTMVNFEPDLNIKKYIINMENMDIIDTYGAQVCNDFVGKISKSDAVCSMYGVGEMAKTLFELFSNLKGITICNSEDEAILSINS